MMKRSETPDVNYFVAFASRVVPAEDGTTRTGVEFEAVPFQLVEAFITGDTGCFQSSDLSQTGKEYEWLYHRYMEYGPEDEEFNKRKLSYLGNEMNLNIVTVWFRDSTEAKAISLSTWYHLIPGDDYQFYLEPFAQVGVRLYSTCKIIGFKKSENRTLNELFQSKSRMGFYERAGMVRPLGITEKTRFGRTRVFYVGAALCIGFFSSIQISANEWVVDRIVGFFDLGCSPGSTSLNPYVEAHSAIAVANRLSILNELSARPEKVIIISHWHQDHVNLIRYMLTPEYNNFWAKSDWYAPQSASPTQTLVAQKLTAYDGNYTVLVNQEAPSAQIQRIQKNPYLAICKIDVFDQPHPHHHGICASINLLNKTDTALDFVLLAGDCTYKGIPELYKNGKFKYLQAGHHGGEYALPPSEGDRRVHIPVPSTAAGATAGVIYSANGVTYGHPNAQVMLEHQNAGWYRSWRTDEFAAGGQNGFDVPG